MILDGVPASSIWAIDLTPDYWEAAKQLWGDDKPGSRCVREDKCGTCLKV